MTKPSIEGWVTHRLIRPFVTQLADADQGNLLVPSGMYSRAIMLASAAKRVATEERMISFLDVRPCQGLNKEWAGKLGIPEPKIEFHTPAKLRMEFPRVRDELAKTEMFVMLQAIGHRGTQSRVMLNYMVRHFPYLHLCLHMQDLEKFVDLLPRNSFRIVPNKASSYFFPIFGNPNPFGPFGNRSYGRRAR